MRPSRGTSRRTLGRLGGRSHDVVRRVLDAALRELACSGYAALRMDVIATEAAVNKTTIYRRWPTRAALVAAVVERLRQRVRQLPLPDTGRLEADLLAAFARRAAVARTVEGRAWAHLRRERHHPEVEAIIGAAVDARRDEWRAMITRAIHRGEVPPETDAALLLEVARAIVDARAATAAWRLLAVRTAIAGARAGTLARRRRVSAVAAAPARRR